VLFSVVKTVTKEERLVDFRKGSPGRRESMKISHDKADAEAILRRPASRMMDWGGKFLCELHAALVVGTAGPDPRTGCGQYDAVATTDPTPQLFQLNDRAARLQPEV